MLNNIDFTEELKQQLLINGLIIFSVTVILSLIYGYAYLQVKKRYRQRYDVLLAAFEMEAMAFYEERKKDNQAKAKLSDGFIFILVDLAKLADQLHLVSENEQKRWRSALEIAYDHLEKKITAIRDEGEEQQAQKELLLQKIATLRELV
ncbi:MAG: hypothetical protein EAY81_02535 [Bacteroidetes bacterium]|nr:MAG: hypothetical protein EAY81_02535 [Bacteroidota bacterium]